MKKLLMSVAFIALAGSIVPADAAPPVPVPTSTLAIGGGANLGHVFTGTGAASTGTAAAGSLANGQTTNIGAGFAASTPVGGISTGLGASAGQSNSTSGAVSFGMRPSPAVSRTTSVSALAEASPTCCPNVVDSSMVPNLGHHAADRVGVRCLQKTSVLCGKFFPPRGGGLPPYGQSFDGVGGMTFIWASIRTSWRSIDCRGRARRNGCKENEPTRCCGQDVDCIRGFRGRW